MVGTTIQVIEQLLRPSGGWNLVDRSSALKFHDVVQLAFMSTNSWLALSSR